MASLLLAGVSKSYGKKRALRSVDLGVADGEFFVILGPSGAGKTTTLKSVAGLQEIDGGAVQIGGLDMEGIEPYRRNVAMAFESYALYPQDTVFDNLASPLRSGRVGSYSKDEQRQRIEMVTTTLGIEHLLQRYPRELSNGQRQRVALGRVLVRPAGIYLLDEPLSHLDAKLRAAMRAELKSLGTMARTTTLYVTHDYQEALALGDKVAVLRAGRVVQVGTPLQVWREPVSTFVARALGQPEINLVPAAVDDGAVTAAGGALRFDVPAGLDLAAGQRLTLGVRPREIVVAADAPAGGEWVSAGGTLRLAEVLGRDVELSVDVGGTELIMVVQSEHTPDDGAQVRFHVPLAHTLVFDAEADERAEAGTDDAGDSGDGATARSLLGAAAPPAGATRSRSVATAYSPPPDG